MAGPRRGSAARSRPPGPARRARRSPALRGGFPRCRPSDSSLLRRAEQLRKGRHDPEANAGVHAAFHHPQHLDLRGGRDGDDDQFGVAFCRTISSRSFVPPSTCLHAVQRNAVLARIVVHEADGHDSRRGVPAEVAEQPFAGVAPAADDERCDVGVQSTGVRRRPRFRPVDPTAVRAPPSNKSGQRQVDEQDGAGEVREAGDGASMIRRSQRMRPPSPTDRDQVRQPGEPPQPPVESEADKSDERTTTTIGSVQRKTFK